MSVLDVWNAALSAAHARGRLSSLTENSPEREVCSEWYSIILGSIQSAAWWPSCKAIARLAELAEADDTWADGEPEPGYNYAFAMPASFLHPWHLTDYSRFSLSFSSTLNRQILSTNTPAAALVYARLNEDPGQWGAGQMQATVFALASAIAGPLTGQGALVQRNYQLAQNLLDTERARVANTIEPAPRPAVPWLAARGYSSAPMSRFFYPFGSLYSSGAVSAS